MKRQTSTVVLTLIFSCAVINYIDRQALSVAAPAIRKELIISNSDYGWVLFCFLLAYALAQPICGWFLDRVGTVAGFSVAVVWWSIACALHSFAGGALSFGAYRFLLGAGEAALIPASIKAISEWLPANQRARGIGFMNAGISTGGLIATPVVGWMLLTIGWRLMFVITGALGAIWLLFWMLAAPKIPTLERVVSTSESLDYRALLKRKEILGLILARVISDPAWYFYLFWLPSYLAAERGFDMKQLAKFGWIPYATATAGALFSGWLATRLLSQGWSIDRTRKRVLLIAAVLMPLGVLVTFVPSIWLALALVSLMTMLIQIWATSLFAIPADLFPSSKVASVVGFATAAGSASAMLFQTAVGYVVDWVSYTPIFITVALMHPLALFFLSRLIPRIGPLALEDETNP